MAVCIRVWARACECEKKCREEVSWGGFNGQEGRGRAHPGQQQSSPPSMSPSYRHVPALATVCVSGLWPECSCGLHLWGRVTSGGSRCFLFLFLPSLSSFTNMFCFCSVTGSRQETVSCVSFIKTPYMASRVCWPGPTAFLGDDKWFPWPSSLLSIELCQWQGPPLLKKKKKHSNMRKHSYPFSCCSGKRSIKIALRLYYLRLSGFSYGAVTEE